MAKQQLTVLSTTAEDSFCFTMSNSSAGYQRTSLHCYWYVVMALSSGGSKRLSSTLTSFTGFAIPAARGSHPLRR
ncbi:hypothetical protein PF002_g8253 [Phytophthora fragariae]|uniref:Uncharacterized protein n=1 Tax=Phytophthora fragariae TaxID=53985 RepID=A0A6A3ZT87_9STRA|nr:hypothetical protein PF002_g8253 [Phytophthora fragariae]